MMHRMLLSVLLLCCLLLSGCSHDPIAPMADLTVPADIPAPAAAVLPPEETSVTLWFRFGTEPVLAAENRRLYTPAGTSLALNLMQALISGPSAASTELQGLFPQGTRVISVHQSQRLMFVTLSRQIMNGFHDEPEAWHEDPYWRIEVPRRRQLAMQSIAATLTENCDVDTVIILVEQSGSATDSLRLRNSYYTLDGDPTISPPLTRDEKLLLSPARTAEIILECWQEADWLRLYRYTAKVDPISGAHKPEESDFAHRMQSLPRLLHGQAEGGSISMDGKQAIFTLNGAWLQDGTEKPFTGLPLRLIREKELWRVGVSQLTGWEVLP